MPALSSNASNRQNEWYPHHPGIETIEIKLHTRTRPGHVQGCQGDQESHTNLNLEGGRVTIQIRSRWSNNGSHHTVSHGPISRIRCSKLNGQVVRAAELCCRPKQLPQRTVQSCWFMQGNNSKGII